MQTLNFAATCSECLLKSFKAKRKTHTEAELEPYIRWIYLRGCLLMAQATEQHTLISHSQYCTQMQLYTQSLFSTTSACSMWPIAYIRS